MTRGGATYYYTFDGLGSVRNLTSQTQTLVEQYDYDSFGNLTAPPTTGNPYTYTSREYDPETGLLFYRARYYDPKDGRFITEDPIGFEGGINFYSYVQGNPINARDPSGTKKKKSIPETKYWWEDCNAAIYAECILECFPKRVKSCKVRYKASWTFRNGKLVPTITELGRSCNCEDEEEDDGFGGPLPDPINPCNPTSVPPVMTPSPSGVPPIIPST
jgi:RHS repeat-associated protein